MPNAHAHMPNEKSNLKNIYLSTYNLGKSLGFPSIKSNSVKYSNIIFRKFRKT